MTKPDKNTIFLSRLKTSSLSSQNNNKPFINLDIFLESKQWFLKANLSQNEVPIHLLLAKKSLLKIICQKKKG